jgi:hypothetical protein
MPTARGNHMDGHASIKQKGFVGAPKIVQA